MAGEDDVTATLGLDYSAYLKGLGVARDEMGRFTKAVVDMDTRAGRAMKANAAGIGGLSSKVRTLRPALQEMTDGTIKAAGGLKEMQAQSAQLMRLSAVLGPELGSLVAMAGKVRGTQSSGIGGATLAMGAFGVALGAVYKVGSTVVDVLGDIESHAGQIEKARLGGLITADEVKNIEAAAIAYENLWTPLDDLQILLTAHVSPAISNFAIGLEYVSALARGFTMDEAIQQAQDFYDKIHGLNTLDSAVPDWMKTLPGNKPVSEHVSVDQQKAKDDAARATAQPATARNRAAPSGGVDAIESSMFLAGITIPKSQIDLHAAGLAAITDLDKQYADQKAALDKQIADDAIAQMDRETAARQAAVQNAIAGASAVASSLIDLGTQATDAAVANTEEGTEAHRQALRDQLTMQEAAAIAQAALGIVNIWSQWAAQPIVAGALTAIELAATGIAIGQIESQKAKLHTGGLAPDERYGMPQPITRNNERTAVLTQEGQRHLNELDRINAGAMGGGQILQVVVRDDSGRRMSGRQFARPDPGVGFATRAVRS